MNVKKLKESETHVVNLINLENVEKSYGLKTLLDKVSLGINEGDRIGVGLPTVAVQSS